MEILSNRAFRDNPSELSISPLPPPTSTPHLPCPPVSHLKVWARRDKGLRKRGKQVGEALVPVGDPRRGGEEIGRDLLIPMHIHVDVAACAAEGGGGGREGGRETACVWVWVWVSECTGSMCVCVCVSHMFMRTSTRRII